MSMNAMFGVGIVAAIVYGLLIDGTYLMIYFACLAFYTYFFTYLMIDRKHFSTRKIVNLTSWNGKTI